MIRIYCQYNRYASPKIQQNERKETETNKQNWSYSDDVVYKQTDEEIDMAHGEYNENKIDLLNVYKRNINWLKNSEVNLIRKKNRMLKEEQEQCSFVPKTINQEERSVSNSKNKEKIDDFYERNRKWDSKRKAKWEMLKQEMISRELDEMKSPNQYKNRNNFQSNHFYSKTKSISKRSNREPIINNENEHITIGNY